VLAKKQNAVVLFAGLPDEYESEGFDRKTLAMPESHNALIEAVAKVNPNIVVVLQLGAPVLLPWVDKVKGILVAYLGGQAGGSALADVLSGAVSPSGKLTETWPLSLEATPSYANFPGGTKTVEYRESLFVGYRYYDLSTTPVAYPFGHGLSYTTFEYSDLRLDRATFASGDAPLTARVTVKNTGARSGAEVVQLYVAAPQTSALYRARKELKGFEKVVLAPGASAEAAFTLDARSFAYYNTRASDWAIEGGEYTILVGGSSADIRLQKPVSVRGDGKESQLAFLRAAAPCYFSINGKSGGLCVSDASFTAVYGRALPPAERVLGELFTVNSTLREFKDTPIGEKLAAFIARSAQTAFAGDNDISLIIDTMIADMPLRTLAMMGGDQFPASAIPALVDALNGNPSAEILAILG
jgi:beta-glucosidase